MKRYSNKSGTMVESENGGWIQYEDSAHTELPQYQCFKVVGALKIRRLDVTDECKPGELKMIPWKDGYKPIILSKAYVDKHKPQVGGYYVVYVDGYKSYSPTQAFESGYNEIIIT